MKVLSIHLSTLLLQMHGPNGDPSEHTLPMIKIHYAYTIRSGIDGFYASE